MRGIILTGVLNSFFIVLPLFTHAQSVDNALSVSPEYPEVGEIYTVKFSNYSSSRSSIQWFINGVEDTLSKNKASITLQADTIDTTTVTARVTEQDGTKTETKRTISPNRVDLVINADTVVPAFYDGRTLPSSGSAIHARALVFTKANLPPGSYSYLWKVNDKTQLGGPVRGKNTFEFTPGFEEEILVSVDVLGNNGAIVAQESELVPIVKPELYFYEKNPLRGLSYNAILDEYVFIGNEATIRGEGYYMSRDLFGTDVLREWKIDGKTSGDSAGDPNEITIEKNGEGGTSKLSFHIRNLRQLLQGVEESISIKF